MNLTFEELMEQIADIPSNYNEDTFRQFHKWVPTLPAGEFVDFGTGLGKSVVAIAILNPYLRIISIDTGVPYDLSSLEYKRLILDTFQKHNVGTRISFDVADSLSFPWQDPLVGLNIDSGHSYELTRDEISRWIPFVQKNGLIFMDDYLIERVGVKQAVDESVLKDTSRFLDLNPDGMCCVFRKL